MVWARFTYDRKIALEVIDGNMTAVKYRDDILRDVILPFKQQHPVENLVLPGAPDDKACRLQDTEIPTDQCRFL
nr:hypothetical protein BaRGS_033081 [Batillaria attramentaria]KAG5700507.1 hypothetical protein BaRGS_013994 [Batillaria attramentaria]